MGNRRQKTNQLAIASLVASLIGVLCGIGSIVGIALGIVAMNQIKQTPRRRPWVGRSPASPSAP